MTLGSVIGEKKRKQWSFASGHTHPPSERRQDVTVLLIESSILDLPENYDDIMRSPCPEPGHLLGWKDVNLRPIHKYTLTEQVRCEAHVVCGKAASGTTLKMPQTRR